MKRKLLFLTILSLCFSVFSSANASNFVKPTISNSTEIATFVRQVEPAPTTYCFGTSCGYVGVIHSNHPLTDEQVGIIADGFETAYCAIPEMED